MGRAARQKRERNVAILRDRWRELLDPDFLLGVRTGILRSGARRDSCICSTKVMTQIGDMLDIKVEPLVVETSVFNPVFTQHFLTYGTDTDETTMTALGERGGRFVVLGCRQDRTAAPDKWPGHLVAVAHPPRCISSQPHVIDLSIDQAHRPQKDILLEAPLAFPIPGAAFLEGKLIAVGNAKTPRGNICFVYRAFPEDRSYEVSPDWRRTYQIENFG